MEAMNEQLILEGMERPHATWNEAAADALADVRFQALDVDLQMQVAWIGYAWDAAWEADCYYDDEASAISHSRTAAQYAFTALTERGYGHPLQAGFGVQLDPAYTRRALLDLLVERQAKYGPKNITKFGLQGILIRLSDKVERLRNLASGVGAETADESIDDTLADVVGYYVVARILADGEFELPLEKTNV